jgi:Domain of unknown function (DUF4465)
MRLSWCSLRPYLLAMIPAALIALHAPAAVVDFDDLIPTNAYAGPGGGAYWNGPDPNGTDEPDPHGAPLPVRVGNFVSRNVGFRNRYNFNYGSWQDFAYSNTVDNATAGFENQYSAFPGSGRGPGQDNYAVANGFRDLLDPTSPMELAALPTLELQAGMRVTQAYVSNATYAALSMLHGDAFAKKFGGPSGNDPDFLMLTAYGTDSGGMPLPERVDFYLADYRFTNSADDYIVDEWELLDLSPLARAKRIHFNLTSSDVGLFGMNTPGYFVIDDLKVTTRLCDLNGDDLCNALDVDSLVAEIARAGSRSLFDLDGNGENNLQDLDEWLSLAGNENLGSGRSYVAADANLDGVVDGSDFGVWNTNKFLTTGAWTRGDFNADGLTDGSDFGIWNSHKFQSSDAQVVPESAAHVWGWVSCWMTLMFRCARKRDSQRVNGVPIPPRCR